MEMALEDLGDKTEEVKELKAQVKILSNIAVGKVHPPQDVEPGYKDQGKDSLVGEEQYLEPPLQPVFEGPGEGHSKVYDPKQPCRMETRRSITDEPLSNQDIRELKGTINPMTTPAKFAVALWTTVEPHIATLSNSEFARIMYMYPKLRENVTGQRNGLVEELGSRKWIESGNGRCFTVQTTPRGGWVDLLQKILWRIIHGGINR